MTSTSSRDTIGMFRQFLRFGVVGGSGFLVNIALAIMMNKLNGGPQHSMDVLFKVPGVDLSFRFTHLVWIVPFIIANVWNYQLNRMWTFKGNTRGWWSGLWPFMAIGSVAAAVGLVIKTALLKDASPFYLGFDWLDGSSGLRSREYWAQLITILVTMPINFIVNKIWTFGGKHAGAQS